MLLRKTLFLVILISSFGALSVSADDFMSTCQSRTAEFHPEIDDPKTACVCIAEASDTDILLELTTAETPADLSEAAKAIMRACGFNV